MAFEQCYETTTLIISMLVVLGVSSSFASSCDSVFATYRHPDDCRRRIQCVWSKPVEMPMCPEGLVYNSKLLVCVRKGSTLDDCSESQDFDVAGLCRLGREIIPHPSECQQYYNCSYTVRSRFYPDYLNECTYPDLFNTETMKCDRYTNVQCGGRKEHTFACSYLFNQCPVAHCRPCAVDHADCSYLPDGRQPHPLKRWTPVSVICKDGRAVKYPTCGQDGEAGFIFSPDTNQCEDIVIN